ncbi:MAG: hypothetical protein ACREKK_01425 [Candidatus Methylomirabilales bacterium]
MSAEEEGQPFALIRELVERWTRADWPRARCSVCGLGTIVVRGMLLRHEAKGSSYTCRGSGTVPGPPAKGKGEP